MPVDGEGVRVMRSGILRRDSGIIDIQFSIRGWVAMFSTLVVVGVLLCQLNAPANSKADGPDASRAVPLKSMVTTGPQKEMQQAANVFQLDNGKRDNKAYYNNIGEVMKGTRSGASNAFLVDATTVRDAIKASTRIILGSRAARTPAPVDKPEPVRGSHWLVAYLGTGPSSPTWWTVEGVTVDGKTIRMTYRESSPTDTTRDAELYYYWAPLGQLAPGVYDLVLFDAGRNRISLMRKVEVGSNEDGGRQ